MSPRPAAAAHPGADASARRFLVEPFLDHLRFERGLAGNTLLSGRSTASVTVKAVADAAPATSAVPDAALATGPPA